MLSNYVAPTSIVDSEGRRKYLDPPTVDKNLLYTLYVTWPGKPFAQLNLDLEDDKTRLNHIRTGCKVWVNTREFRRSGYLLLLGEDRRFLVDAVVSLTQMAAINGAEAVWEAICWVQPPVDGTAQLGASINKGSDTMTYQTPPGFQASQEERAAIRLAAALELQGLFAKMSREMLSEPKQMRMRLHLGHVRFSRLKAELPDIMSYGELKKFFKDAYRYQAKELEKKIGDELLVETVLSKIFKSKGKFLPVLATEDDLSKTKPQNYLIVGLKNMRLEIEIQNQAVESGSNPALGQMRGFSRVKDRGFSCEIQGLCPGRPNDWSLEVLMETPHSRLPQHITELCNKFKLGKPVGSDPFPKLWLDERAVKQGVDMLRGQTVWTFEIDCDNDAAYYLEISMHRVWDPQDMKKAPIKGCGVAVYGLAWDDELRDRNIALRPRNFGKDFSVLFPPADNRNGFDMFLERLDMIQDFVGDTRKFNAESMGPEAMAPRGKSAQEESLQRRPRRQEIMRPIGSVPDARLVPVPKRGLVSSRSTPIVVSQTQRASPKKKDWGSDLKPKPTSLGETQQHKSPEKPSGRVVTQTLETMPEWERHLALRQSGATTTDANAVEQQCMRQIKQNIGNLEQEKEALEAELRTIHERQGGAKQLISYEDSLSNNNTATLHRLGNNSSDAGRSGSTVHAADAWAPSSALSGSAREGYAHFSCSLDDSMGDVPVVLPPPRPRLPALQSSQTMIGMDPPRTQEPDSIEASSRGMKGHPHQIATRDTGKGIAFEPHIAKMAAPELKGKTTNKTVTGGGLIVERTPKQSIDRVVASDTFRSPTSRTGVKSVKDAVEHVCKDQPLDVVGRSVYSIDVASNQVALHKVIKQTQTGTHATETTEETPIQAGVKGHKIDAQPLKTHGRPLGGDDDPFWLNDFGKPAPTTLEPQTATFVGAEGVLIDFGDSQRMDAPAATTITKEDRATNQMDDLMDLRAAEKEQPSTQMEDLIDF